MTDRPKRKAIPDAVSDSRSVRGPENGKYKHGLSTTPEYRTWIGIRSRCGNPNERHWRHYGGRGIKVCSEWQNSFETFLADMGPRPDGHSLDRIDCDGDYSPTNCRWATKQQQMRNMRKNIMVQVNGKCVTLAEAVASLGLKYNTVFYRIRRGATPEEALR